MPQRKGKATLTAYVGENNLSFIETSALDASNVELAFQNILTGTQNAKGQQELCANMVQKSIGSCQAKLSTTTKVHNKASILAQRSISARRAMETRRSRTAVRLEVT